MYVKLAIFVLLCTVVCAGKPHFEEKPFEHVARSIVGQLMELYNQDKIKEFAKLVFLKDVKLAVQGQQTTVGIKAARKGWQDSRNKYPVLKVDVMEALQMSPKRAYSMCYVTFLDNDGNVMFGGIRALAIWVKKRSGWKVANEIMNTL